MLVRETYPNQKVGALMAKNFISIKIDAEKGEGVELAKRFEVRGFPTLLIADAKGEEVDRIIGYRPPEAFIAALQPILDGKSFGAFKSRLAENLDDFEALLGLAAKYEERNDYEKAEELCRRLLEKESAPAALKGRAEGRLPLIEYGKSRGRNAAGLQKYFDANRGTDGLEEHARALFFHNQREENTGKVVQAAEYLLAHGSGEDAQFLNNYAWYLATHGEHLKKALELARKAVQLSPESAHILDTLAEACARNGLHREAVEAQRKAVKLATDRQRAEFEKRLKEFEKAIEEDSEKKDE